MLGRRQRRWAYFKQKLDQRLVFAGIFIQMRYLLSNRNSQSNKNVSTKLIRKSIVGASVTER